MQLLRVIGSTSIFLLVCNAVWSQPKEATPFKVAEPPLIDGRLDEPSWKLAEAATHFIQHYPSFGNAASQRTEVKILYDDQAIYIGAHLFDDPSLIRRQLTARDEENDKDVDYFGVFLDTYNDHQNGFQFLVTTANVQTDARLSPAFLPADAGDFGDKTWDAVWQSQVTTVADGWMVEIRIPYLSLRFSKKEMQDWGLQFMRSVRRRNETSFWNPVDPKVNGFVNQFGLLKNLQKIKPPLRLSFSPYVSAGFRSTPESGAYRNEPLASGGMDVKIGINESFTLDATLVPDFGQVVSDNIVNNLTPYEIRFADYRPFFTEGTEIFNKGGLFYSRRIGDIPSGYYDVKDLADADPDIEIIRNPASTRLYNGLKFSGRTRNKLGIGVFNAVTAPMYASIRDKSTNLKTRILTEPLSNYNIIVLDQALKGRSFITFTNTNVLRNGEAPDANASGLDFSFYDHANTYNLRGYFHYSKVFDGNSYDGFNSLLRVGKVSGRVQFAYQNLIRSVNYDPTDLGYLQTPNLQINSFTASYNQFTPTRRFLNYSYSLEANYRSIYKPGLFNDLQITATGQWTFKNFWENSFSVGYLPDQHDYFVLGLPVNKYARRPAYGLVNLGGSTDIRKKFLFNYNLLVADFFKVPGKHYHIIEGGARYRFGNKFSLDLSHRHERETDYIVRAGNEINGDPIIGFVDFKDVTSILSGIYSFAPRINLTMRIRHYWSQVLFNRFANVDDRGNPLPRAFIPGMDENFNVFNVDAFLTWDFRYGSRLIFGYKNGLGDDEFVDGVRYRSYLKNFGQTFSLRHANEVTLRFIYFLDYSQLKKRR